MTDGGGDGRPHLHAARHVAELAECLAAMDGLQAGTPGHRDGLLRLARAHGRAVSALAADAERIAAGRRNRR